MSEYKTSKAQRKASDKWKQNNPERNKYIRYRTTARTFVRHWATKEDLDELIKIFEDRQTAD